MYVKLLAEYLYTVGITSSFFSPPHFFPFVHRTLVFGYGEMVEMKVNPPWLQVVFRPCYSSPYLTWNGPESLGYNRLDGRMRPGQACLNIKDQSELPGVTLFVNYI